MIGAKKLAICIKLKWVFFIHAFSEAVPFPKVEALSVNTLMVTRQVVVVEAVRQQGVAGHRVATPQEAVVWAS